MGQIANQMALELFLKIKEKMVQKNTKKFQFCDTDTSCLSLKHGISRFVLWFSN